MLFPPIAILAGEKRDVWIDSIQIQQRSFVWYAYWLGTRKSCKFVVDPIRKSTSVKLHFHIPWTREVENTVDLSEPFQIFLIIRDGNTSRTLDVANFYIKPRPSNFLLDMPAETIFKEME